ncbi:MAG: hypothetical protein ACYC46_03785 [Acidobacteriaceae bacterium]
MARGWESKSVEDSQQDQQAQQSSEPLAAKNNSAEVKAQEAHTKRKRQELELQRERILSERTNSPHRRAALSAALEEIEAKLAELGWSIHM